MQGIHLGETVGPGPFESRWAGTQIGAHEMAQTSYYREERKVVSQCATGSHLQTRLTEPLENGPLDASESLGPA